MNARLIMLASLIVCLLQLSIPVSADECPQCDVYQNWLDENPDVEAPTSWDDLLKPEFEGQLMVAHPSFVSLPPQHERELTWQGVIARKQ